MNRVNGKLRPLHDSIIVSDMEFGLEKTLSGILIQSDDGKSSGVHPRWAKVYAVGPEQTSVNPGEWILLEHGRWSRGIKYVEENGNEKTIHLADKNAILMASDKRPADVLRSDTIGAGSNVNFNIPGA